MEEDFNPIKEYNEGKKLSFNLKAYTKVFLMIFFVLYFGIFGLIMFVIGMQDEWEAEELTEKDYQMCNYSTLDLIEYRNGSKIPTLYKYTKYQDAISSKYRFEDDRLGESVTTIEINFTDIPEEYLTIYKNALIDEGYSYVADWENDEVYTKASNGLNPQTMNIEPFNSFVIIGNTRVIYGVLLGDYERIFK